MINEISVLKIRDAVERLCIEANKDLPKDVVCKLCDAKCNESNCLAKSVLEEIELNNGIQTLGKQLFYGCSGLKVIKIPASVSEFGKDMFTGTALMCRQKVIYAENILKLFGTF